MSHQPFETWILAEEPLTVEQAHALHAHLEVCEACHRLSSASSYVDQLLRTIPSMRPATGFTSRWQARLVEKSLQAYRQRQRSQSWWFFALNTFGAVLFLVLLATQYSFAIDSPITLILSSVRLATSWLSFANVVQEILTTFLSVIVRIVPPFWWVVVATGISVLSLIWIFSLRQLLLPRRTIL